MVSLCKFLVQLPSSVVISSDLDSLGHAVTCIPILQEDMGVQGETGEEDEDMEDNEEDMHEEDEEEPDVEDDELAMGSMTVHDVHLTGDAPPSATPDAPAADSSAPHPVRCLYLFCRR